MGKIKSFKKKKEERKIKTGKQINIKIEINDFNIKKKKKKDYLNPDENVRKKLHIIHDNAIKSLLRLVSNIIVCVYK